MREQLRSARDAWWTFTGILELGDESFGELVSINERRCFEMLRLAADIASINPKPLPIRWVDDHLKERLYKADARVTTTDGEEAVIEFKPHGFPRPGSRAEKKYQAVGRYLKDEGKKRFGLVTCDESSIFYRNIEMLNRYWKVDPGRVAVDAFAEVGNHVASIGELLDRTHRDCWPALWAGITHQHVVANLQEALLSRDSLVSMPGYIYEPISLRGLVSTWWA